MVENKIIKFLRCPCCNEKMAVKEDGKTLFCLGERMHCFDFSSKGYVNLAINRGVTGDSKQAVRSRTEFLNKEYYAPVADKLVELLSKYKTDGFVIDAGCGEGYYTEKMAQAGYLTLGLDLSKIAVDSLASRMKCKTNENAFACVSSVFEMPLSDKCADAAVSIFAPCAEDEIDRVLSDNGVFIVVSAGEDHLMGLKRALYSEAYKNDSRADMPQKFRLAEKAELKYSITLENNQDILNLFSMTPYYWRTSPNDVLKLRHLSQLTTQVDILFSVYVKSFKEQV